MNWRKTAVITAAVLAFGILVHAGSTKLVMSWRNPNYSGAPFHRLLVIGMSENPVVHLDFEDAPSEKPARDGLEAVPGNAILYRPDSPDMDIEYPKGQIRDHKIDAALVSRLIKVDKKTTVVSGQPYAVPYSYYNHYGFYGTVYRQVYTPDYLRKDTSVCIGTNLYSATPPNEELVWVGYIDTFNPKNANKIIAALVKFAVKELEKQAILTPRQ